MKKQAFTFGLIGGALIAVYSFIVFLVLGDPEAMTSDDMRIAEVFGYLRYVILLLAVFFVIRTYRRSQPAPVRYMGLVKAGLLCALAVGLCVGLMELIYIAMNPGFMDSYGKIYIEGLEKGGASAEEIAQAKQYMDDYKWMSTPALAWMFYFVETFIVGMIGSLIISIFFKPKAPNNDVKTIS
jgi:hypothetical protein